MTRNEHDQYVAMTVMATTTCELNSKPCINKLQSWTQLEQTPTPPPRMIQDLFRKCKPLFDLETSRKWTSYKIYSSFYLKFSLFSFLAEKTSLNLVNYMFNYPTSYNLLGEWTLRENHHLNYSWMYLHDLRGSSPRDFRHPFVKTTIIFGRLW